MNKKDIINNLDVVIKDLKTGLKYIQDGDIIPWEDDGWEAMIDLLKQVKSAIKEMT